MRERTPLAIFEEIRLLKLSRRLVAGGEQLGDVGGVVLAVAVEGGDPRRAGRAHPVPHRRALPAAGQVADHPQLRIALLLGGEHRHAVVAGLVVHVDDLEIQLAAQGGGDLGQQRGNVVALVEHRHDDGKLRHGRSP